MLSLHSLPVHLHLNLAYFRYHHCLRGCSHCFHHCRQNQSSVCLSVTSSLPRSSCHTLVAGHSEGHVIPNAFFWNTYKIKSQKTISNVYTMLNAGKLKKSGKEILVNLIYGRIIPYVPEVAIIRL
jgi:hypothetical protein